MAMLASPYLRAAALAGLALALRCVGLGSAPLWLDEAVSHRFAGLGWRPLLAALELDSGPPGYYLALELWMAVAGDSEAALRALSALFGAALVAAIYAAGRRLFGETVGLTAGLLTAVLPLLVRLGQEARGYTLLSLAGLGAMVGLALWIEEGRRRWLALHAGSLLAALYTHNTAVFLFAAALTFAALAALRTGARLRPFAGLAIATVGYLPWVPFLLRQAEHRAPVAWMEVVWRENGAAGSLAASLAALAPGGETPGYIGLPAGAWPGLAAGLAAVLLALGGWAALRRPRAATGGDAGPGRRPEGPGAKAAQRRASGERKAPRSGQAAPGPAGGPRPFPLVGAWLLLYLLVPLVAAVAYSAVSTPIYLPGRLDQLVAPAFCLLVAAGLAAIRPRVLSGLALAAVLAASLLHLGRYYAQEPPPAERELAAVIAPSAQPGEEVVATSLTLAPLEYYLRRRDLEVSAFPVELAAHPGNEDPEAWLADRGRLAAEADRLVAAWESSAAPRRVWLAFVASPVDAVLFDRLRASPALHAARNRGTFHQRLLGQEVTLFELSFSRP